MRSSRQAEVDERPNVYDWVELRSPFKDLRPGAEGVVVAFSPDYGSALVQFLGASQPLSVPVELLRMR
jgi:hypothetical protein